MKNFKPIPIFVLALSAIASLSGCSKQIPASSATTTTTTMQTTTTPTPEETSSHSENSDTVDVVFSATDEPEEVTAQTTPAQGTRETNTSLSSEATSTPATTTPASAPVITPLSATYYCNGSSVYVRNAPSTTATITSKLKFADPVNVTGKTTYNGKTWYQTANGNFVVADNFVSEKPVITKIEVDAKGNSKVTPSDEWKKSQATNTTAATTKAASPVYAPGLAAKHDEIFDDPRIVADLIKTYGENVVMRHVTGDGFADEVLRVSNGFHIIDPDSVSVGTGPDGKVPNPFK